MRKLLLFDNMQVKLMLLFFAFTLAPLCTVGFLSIRSAEELVLSMVTNQIEQLVTDKAVLLERWISERKADLEVIAGSSILKSMDSRQITPYLELVRDKYRVYGEISVDYQQPAGTAGEAEGKPPAAAGEPLEPAQISVPLISDIIMSPDRSQSYFRISAPLLGDTGEVRGVVSASVGTGTILAVVLQVSLGATGECYLVNRNGTFLAHREPARILNENIAQSESFRNIFSRQKRGISYTDYRGIEVIGASRVVGGTNWALVVEQDREEALQPVRELRRYMVLVIVLSILGVLFSAWLLSRYVAAPIRRLSAAAHSLARGEFAKVQIDPVGRRDEVGLLNEAFRDMLGQLQDRQQRLEEKVIRSEAELKETDGRLKQSQQAATRSQQMAALGQLAAGVAHEIRTPLTSLKMFLQSIDSEMEISPEYEEDLQVAMTQIQRMEATINRFLDFAKPQSPIFTEVDVRELIEDSLLLVSPRARQQETVMKVEVDASLPTIRGDRKQLGEALLNLLVNALEAACVRGEVKVAVSLVTLDEAGAPQPLVRIDVTDSGPGVAEEVLANLFDPFFTTKSTGTGLGLSIAAATVRSHGGRITVHSHDARGATFSMFLPASSEGMLKDHGTDPDCRR